MSTENQSFETPTIPETSEQTLGQLDLLLSERGVTSVGTELGTEQELGTILKKDPQPLEALGLINGGESQNIIDTKLPSRWNIIRFEQQGFSPQEIGVKDTSQIREGQGPAVIFSHGGAFSYDHPYTQTRYFDDIATDSVRRNQPDKTFLMHSPTHRGSLDKESADKTSLETRVTDILLSLRQSIKQHPEKFNGNIILFGNSMGSDVVVRVARELLKTQIVPYKIQLILDDPAVYPDEAAKEPWTFHGKEERNGFSLKLREIGGPEAGTTPEEDNFCQRKVLKQFVERGGKVTLIGDATDQIIGKAYQILQYTLYPYQNRPNVRIHNTHNEGHKGISEKELLAIKMDIENSLE
jgi:hypothetical protein